MSDTIARQSAVTTAPAGLLPRLIGVLTSPRATYADVAARPRWVGVLAVVVFVSATATWTFSSTEVGQRALLDQQITQLESFGVHLNDAQIQQMEDRLRYGPYIGAIVQMITLPLMAVIIAGLAF